MNQRERQNVSMYWEVMNVIFKDYLIPAAIVLAVLYMVAMVVSGYLWYTYIWIDRYVYVNRNDIHVVPWSDYVVTSDIMVTIIVLGILTSFVSMIVLDMGLQVHRKLSNRDFYDKRRLNSTMYPNVEKRNYSLANATFWKTLVPSSVSVLCVLAIPHVFVSFVYSIIRYDRMRYHNTGGKISLDSLQEVSDNLLYLSADQVLVYLFFCAALLAGVFIYRLNYGDKGE